LHGVPAFATSSDESDAELFIGSEDGLRKDLNAGEGSGGFAEEVTAVGHGIRAVLEWFTPEAAQVHGIETGKIPGCNGIRLRKVNTERKRVMEIEITESADFQSAAGRALSKKSSTLQVASRMARWRLRS
jgi:hypothetical protein